MSLPTVATGEGHQSSGSFCVISTAVISYLLVHDQRQMAQVMLFVPVSEATKECHCLYIKQHPFSSHRINLFTLQRNSTKSVSGTGGLDAPLAESWVLPVPSASLLDQLPYQLSFKDILGHKFLGLSAEDLVFAENNI